MSRCCSDNFGCRPCSGDEGQSDLPEPFRTCFKGTESDEEVIARRSPANEPWVLEESITATPYAAEATKAAPVPRYDDCEEHRGDRQVMDCQVPELAPQQAAMLSNQQMEPPQEWQDAEPQMTPVVPTFDENAEAPAFEPLGLQQDEEGEAKQPKSDQPVLLDEKGIMKEAKWLLYLCCCGFGWGRSARMRLISKIACCRQMCECADFVAAEDGCTSCICSFCWCHALMQLPPHPGTPRCMTCGEITCGLYSPEKEEQVESETQMFKDLLLEGFSPLYCFCAGCSCKKEVTSCAKGLYKCGCCRLSSECALPCEDDGFVYVLSTCANCYYQCRFPPPPFGENPVCALCGYRLRKYKQHHAGVIHAPRQQEMT